MIRPRDLVQAVIFLSLVALSLPATAKSPAAEALNAQIERARTTMLTDPRAASHAARTAAAAAAKLPATQDRAIALATTDWLQAEASLRLGDIDKVETFLDAAAKRTKLPRSQLTGDMLMTRGGMESARGAVGAALRDLHAAFRDFQAIGNERSQSIALTLIASLYSSGKDNERALRYLNQANDVYRGDPSIVLALYNNRAGVLQDLGRHGDSERQYLAALSLAGRMRSPSIMALILGNIARNRLKAGQVALAEAAIRRALFLTSTEKLDRRPQLLALAAEAAFQRGNVRQAADLIDESFKGVDLRKTESSWLEPHITAYRVYAREGRYALAFAHLAAVKRIDDEATTLATNTGNALMAARFDYANQELRIAKLKAEELRRSIALEQARTRFQRIIFLSLVGATVVVIAILAIALFTILRSRNQLRIARDGLAETNVALNKALAAKTEFLATTSHEIRTPLNGILGMTQVMLADTRLDAATRDRLGIVRGAGLTMRALVDDILDVAKMETGHLTLEEAPYDLVATVREASRLWEEQARGAGLDFRLSLPDAPLALIGDAGRVRQIVFNLLSNAVKFTEAGHIALSVTADETAGSVAIAIADTGIGIAADKREAVFESFRQADASTTRTHGGTGLGLAICRNLATAMAGRIDVDSAPSEGSRFTVTLPLRRAAGTVPSADDIRPAPALLVIERSPIQRGMWRTLLERAAGRLIFAADAAAALDAVATDHVARILIDDATLCAEPDPAAAVAQIAAAAGTAETTLLWTEGREGLAPLAPLVTRVATKPIAGKALLALLFDAGCGRTPPSALVSRAA